MGRAQNPQNACRQEKTNPPGCISLAGTSSKCPNRSSLLAMDRFFYANHRPLRFVRSRLREPPRPARSGPHPPGPQQRVGRQAPSIQQHRQRCHRINPADIDPKCRMKIFFRSPANGVAPYPYIDLLSVYGDRFPRGHIFCFTGLLITTSTADLAERCRHAQPPGIPQPLGRNARQMRIGGEPASQRNARNHNMPELTF